MRKTLYLFCSAAPPVFEVAGVVEEAQTRGWDVCLGLTPTAADWLRDGIGGLSALTGRPVRWAYERPGEPEVWPPADALLVAPATLNTVNRWALGLTDTLVTGYAAEAVGRGTPTAVMPCLNTACARHPRFGPSLETLRAAGVRVLYGPEGFEPHEPGEQRSYPWGMALDVADGLG
ncbi:flavoprotein [Streptomyces sp. LP05-1]|uniref:Flavoprotein n=1 Tax=Streptomyces pyxinae TaxID=2970734 RepID=A0ABT2CK02_9ACTN|nr:flavoprotein [Streptomyces sp. LP05-1]MCS0637748.1 flavoprotein [Streptomyces sp. LP05-1]